MTTAGIIAKKIGMTRMVDAEGQMTPVTLLQVETQRVTKVLTPERDGYNAIQVGYYVKKEKALTKADVARLRKASIQESFARFKEFRFVGAPGHELGAALGVNLLEGVTTIDATGVCKGRGFSGAHRKHGSAVGRMSHGSRFHRRPGSLGMRSTPGRTFKNRKQPGHHGNTQTTIQNLKVMDIDTASGVIAVRGSVPGHADGYLILRPSVKAAAATAAGKKTK
jgi:large subunit ribosomal protein L3